MIGSIHEVDENMDNVIDFCARVTARNLAARAAKAERQVEVTSYVSRHHEVHRRSPEAQNAEAKRLEAVRASWWTGAKHVAGRDLKEIAKDVRKDIASAIKAHTLPAIKSKVRISRFAGGQSLYVVITEVPAGIPVMNPARVIWDAQSHSEHKGDLPLLLAPEMSTIIDTLQGIVDSYNFDKSDQCTDCFNQEFFGHVDLDGDIRFQDRERLVAELTNR